MASLRDLIGVTTDSGQAEQIQQENLAAGMGSLRRGWESGRIGTELNPLRTQALDAKIAGDAARQAELDAQVSALEQRQQRYQPQVSDLRQIDGVGDALSYGAGQVGQGVASMLDPMAAAAGLGVVGRVASNFGAVGKGIGLAAQAGQFAIPYMMSKEQLTGEFIGEAQRDKELMARTAPQGLRDMAGNYGAGAAVFDSALPGIVGRQVSGLSRAGSAAARQGAMGVGAKAGLGMLGEGATEALQAEGSQYARGLLNPNRDTSEDNWDTANNFAGGLIGGAPFSAAGALANAGHNRLDGGIDVVKNKAGEVVDLAKAARESDTGQKVERSIKELWESGKAKTGETIDLAKQKATDFATGEDGSVSMENAVDNAYEQYERVKLRREEKNTLDAGVPDDLTGAPPEKIASWLAKDDASKRGVIDQVLSRSKDPEAQTHLAALQNATDEISKITAFDDALDFARQVTREESTTEMVKEAAESSASWVGELAGKAARGVAGMGMAAAKGAMRGATGKRNAQATDFTTTSYEDWQARRAAMNPPNTVAEGVMSEVNSGVKGTMAEKAKEDSYRRAVMAGEYLASRVKPQRGAPAKPEVADFMRQVGYEITELSDSWGLGMSDKPTDAGLIERQSPGLTMNLDSVAYEMNSVLGKKAGDELAHLEKMMDPKAAPMFEYLRERLISGETTAGRAMRESARELAKVEMGKLLPRQHFMEVMRAGPAAMDKVFSTFEKLSRGRAKPNDRELVDELLGAETVNKIMSLVSGLAVEGRAEKVMQEGVSDFDKAAGEKKMSNSARSVYGFAGSDNLRSNKDPFALSKGEQVYEGTDVRDDLDSDKAEARRPQLYKTTDMWDQPHHTSFKENGNKPISKLDARIAAMKKEVGYVDGKNDDGTANPDLDTSDGWAVEATSAHDVMKALHMNPAKVLSIFKDYLRQDGLVSKRDEANFKTLSKAEVQAITDEREASTKQAREVGQLLARLMSHKQKPPGPESKWTEAQSAEWRQTVARAKKAGYDTENGSLSIAALDTAEVKLALEAAETYFKQRHIVRAFSTTDNDEQKLDLETALEISNKGKSLASVVRRDADAATRKGTAEDGYAVESEANLLWFPKGKDKEGNTTFHPVAARDLVKWSHSVADSRGQSTDGEDTNFGPRASDAKYATALWDGVSAYTHDHADGLPYKLNADGMPEYFGQGKDPIPPSLRLSSGTYAEAKADGGFAPRFVSPIGIKRSVAAEGPNKGRDPKDIRDRAGNQRAVGKESAKSEDFFTAEQREELDPQMERDASGKGKRKEILTGSERAAYFALPQDGSKASTDLRTDFVAALKDFYGEEWAAEFDLLGPNGAEMKPGAARDMKRVGNLSYEENGKRVDITQRGPQGGYLTDRSGQVESEPKAARGDDESTELDFSRGQGEGAPDETTAQNYFTRLTNDRFPTPAKAMQGMSSAKHYAGIVMRHMFNDPRAGDREAITLLRSALKPLNADNIAAGQKYEAYRVAPLINLVSENREATKTGFRDLTNAEYFERAGATTDLIKIIRRGAAEVLLSKSNMSEPHRLTLARQLLGDVSVSMATLRSDLLAYQKALGGEVTEDEMHVNWGEQAQEMKDVSLKPMPADVGRMGSLQAMSIPDAVADGDVAPPLRAGLSKAEAAAKNEARGKAWALQKDAALAAPKAPAGGIDPTLWSDKEDAEFLASLAKKPHTVVAERAAVMYPTEASRRERNQSATNTSAGAANLARANAANMAKLLAEVTEGVAAGTDVTAKLAALQKMMASAATPAAAAPLSANDQMVANAKARFQTAKPAAAAPAAAKPAAAPAAPAKPAAASAVKAPFVSTAPEGYVAKTPTAATQAKIDAAVKPADGTYHAAIRAAIQRNTIWRESGDGTSGPGLDAQNKLLTRWLAMSEAEAKAAALGNNSANAGAIVRALQEGSTGSPLGKPGGVTPSAQVTVTDHQSSGYRDRTKHNADSAGATVAIAIDFSTAGERLTRSVAGDRYVAIDYGMPAEAAGAQLAKFMRDKGTDTLNIAGNGIYTLFDQRGLEQSAVNAYIHSVIAAAHKLHPISKIVSGGQTGVDIAGAVAAKALGIPAVITLPHGYVQRNKFKQDQQVGKAAVEQQIEDGAKALEKPGSKRNNMVASVSAELASSREIMRSLGFKSAPEGFADVSAKLLSDPDQDIIAFIRDSATALSHILMGGANVAEIKAAVASDAWAAHHTKNVARLVAGGLNRQKAAHESYRQLVEMALAGELAARTKAQTSALTYLTNLVKDFVSKFKAMVADHKYMYHGTRAKDEMLVRPDGSLLLKPSKNFEGKTFGVSFTHDVASANDYATRIKGGGPKGFTFKGAKLLKIDRAALKNIEEEAFGEWADYTGKDVVIPKGMYSIEPVARDRYFLHDSWLYDDADYSFKDYKKDYGSGGYEYDSGADNADEMERDYLENLLEEDSGASEADKTEAGKILAEYKRGAPDAPSSSELLFHPGFWDESKRDASWDALLAESQAKLNKQSPDGEHNMASAGEMAAARTWLEKVAPGTVLEFIEETGFSGEFIETENLVRVSRTAAAGILGTTYHEGLHKFFAQFVRSNPELQKKFDNLVNDPKVFARLIELLEGYPAAQDQLVDGEERLAYAFQFWKAGLLRIDNENRSILQKIGALFRRVFGMVRDSEHALAIFQAFDEGKLAKPSVAAQVIAKQLGKGTMALRARRGMDGLMQGLGAAVLPAEVILGSNEHSSTARKLGAIMFTNPGKESAGGGQIGYLNAKRSQGKAWANKANTIFENMAEVDITAVQKYMQAQTYVADIKMTAHREAVTALRTAMKEFHTYLRESGLKVGEVDKYYPVVWSIDALHKNKDKFIDMLVTKYPKELNATDGDLKAAAERIHTALIDRNGVDNKGLKANREEETGIKEVTREDGVLSPFFAGQEGRTLWWLDGKDSEAYQSKSITHTMSQYFHQGVRAAEYHRRFGESGIKLELMIKQIRAEIEQASVKMYPPTKQAHTKHDPNAVGAMVRTLNGDREKWAARQMRDISMSIGAIEGTLGKDISPNMRKFNSYMIAYQNVRLLPYMIFSSFTDPLAQVARGAPMKAAMEIFTRGMREVFQSWADMFRDMPKARQKDEWTKLAEHIGAIEVAMFNHHVADEYSSVYMSPVARKINETLFKMNGMEAWDRANRTMAVKWAVRFIEQHAGLPDKNHSARWLEELGLSASTVPLNADGQLITTAEELSIVKGISPQLARLEIAKVHAALNRWVEGAVISPNAAQRPGWSSDPNFASMFHLKQFSYSFQQTIMQRAVNELEHGNLTPITALAGFVPTMLVADLMKGLLQGAGTLPAHMAGMDAGERITRAMERSGVMGTGDIASAALQDWSSLGGPAFEQIVDGLRDAPDRTLTKAIPLHAMGEHLFSGRSALEIAEVGK